ncbi:MAG: glycosyltransferase [Paludibacter sp.]|nr:glycosyltransferase [Paludibacter sp.]
MITITILISTLCIAYLALVVFFIKGWANIPYFENHNKNLKNKLPSISVVVAAKNEEKNIANLLQSLVNQSDKNFELIIINDNSQDNTLAEIEKFHNFFKKMIILDAKNSGKKFAVNQAINSANGDIILTTDADCAANEKWVETVRHFQAENDCDLLILPVFMRANDLYFSDIQQLEFISLVASGAGAVGGGSPIMCNAANMAFKKEIYLRSQNDLQFLKQSGDDVFLLESVKRAGGKIRFVKSQDAVIQTNACENLHDFFRQRSRWAGKASAYSDKLLVCTALTVFLISLSQITTFVLGFFAVKYFAIFLSIFLIKYLTDIIFINKIKVFFKIKNIALNAFLLSLIYPVYICITAIYGLFFKNVKWK